VAGVAGMINAVLISLFHLLAGMFLIGMLGCLIVIPITAYRLFRVLFEKDVVDEEEASA
jgi:uncharacterized membrane protein